MNKIQIDNASAMIEKPIKEGRITGLKQWDGKTAIVIIVKSSED